MGQPVSIYIMNYNLLLYSRQKYYCYHQNAKYFLLPFKDCILRDSDKITVTFR